MTEDNFVTKTRKSLPEGIWRFLIIGFIIYAFVVVGKVIYDNYGENKTVTTQQQSISNLKEQITDLQLNIAYYQTETYKEKIARAKLRYALPGETVVAVPYDQQIETQAKKQSSPATLSEPNYHYWIVYFFGQ